VARANGIAGATTPLGVHRRVSGIIAVFSALGADRAGQFGGFFAQRRTFPNPFCSSLVDAATARADEGVAA